MIIDLYSEIAVKFFHEPPIKCANLHKPCQINALTYSPFSHQKPPDCEFRIFTAE